MPKLELTLGDFDYAAKQIDKPLKLRFGDLDWERCLAQTSKEFYGKVILVSGNDFLQAETSVNNALRRAATLVCAAAFHAEGGKLVRITLRDWQKVRMLYGDDLSGLAVRSDSLLNSVNAFWANIWATHYHQEIERNGKVSEAQKWFLNALVMLVVAGTWDEALTTLLPDEGSSSETAARRAAVPANAPVLVAEEKVTFAGIGGCRQAKQKLMRIASAVNRPDIWRSWGARPVRGVMLWGPPGTGKTMLAKALAEATGRKFRYIKAGDIVTMWYGQSARNISELLDAAAKDNGCVLFFDEAEALFARRDGQTHEETLRLIGTLNAGLDGLSRPQDVLTVFATNRKDLMDDAVVREGRVDLHIECGLPDRDDRREILAIHMRTAQAHAGCRLFRKLDAAVLDATAGMSGAGLAEAVRRVVEEKASLQLESGLRPDLVTTDDMLAAIAECRRERSVRKSRIGFLK